MIHSLPAVRAIVVTTLLLGACLAQKGLELPDSEVWDAAVEAGTRTKSGQPGERYWSDRASYRIAAELDPATARISGKAVMTYENRSPKRLRTLGIHLRKNLHAEGAVRNMPVKVTGGVKLERVALGGVELREGRGGAGSYMLRGTVLTIILGRDQGEPGSKLEVEVDWSHTCPPSGGAPRTGHENNRTFFLGYWYPQFAVHDDVEGWVADPYLGMGEFYMGYADYEVDFTVPQGFIVRATGELANPGEVLAERTRAALAKAREGEGVVNVVTADQREAGVSTTTHESGKLTWKFRAGDVRDFAVSVSDLYVWDATSADVGDGGRAMIHAVYEPEVDTWKKAAEYARHTIEFMSRHVGRYPYPHVTVCEGVCGGGMEFPMMTDIGVTGSARGVQGVVAHELIHMWFPMVVGSNEKHYSWMDEGTTSFLTTLVAADYFESSRPPHANSYRGYIRFGSRFSGPPPMRHADGNTSSEAGAHGFATYQKTAAVLHQLRHMIGAETFDAALRGYFERWAYKHPRPRDFFNAMSVAAGRDLDWYFRTWMYETWRLDFSVTEKGVVDGKRRFELRRHGKARGPFIGIVEYADGTIEPLEFSVDDWADEVIEVEYPADVKRVAIDPDGITLDVRPGNNVWTK